LKKDIKILFNEGRSQEDALTGLKEIRRADIFIDQEN
jgi:hypothetical protein